MKLSEMKTATELVEERRRDPGFRREWDRLAVAREVSINVVRYRAEHGLSQRAFAALVGLQQPAVARLENAENQPTLDMLAKLSQATGLRFRIDVADGDVTLTAA